MTMAVAEVLLRLWAPSVLVMGPNTIQEASFYKYDPTLGWFLRARTSGQIKGKFEYSVHQNSLGLRDDEYGDAKSGTIVFLGDSFVWGVDAEQGTRFTDILRNEYPDYRIISAGVAGFGTDQEYMLLKRLWNILRPDTVVLIFCSDNDREDNSHNLAGHLYYKPYFRLQENGLHVEGVPVPASPRYYYAQNSLADHLLIARLVIYLAIRLRNPIVTVPDPTESLIDLTKQYVEGHGARFAVGIEGDDKKLDAFLKLRSIPTLALADAERLPPDLPKQHWSARGQAYVASRMGEFLRALGAVAESSSASGAGHAAPASPSPAN
jgi:hypothetical protein